MKKGKIICCCLCSLLIIGSASFAVAEDKGNEPTGVESSKRQLIEDIDTIVQGLQKTKECLSGAPSEQEMARCHDAERTRKLMEVQDRLSEMGLTWEERKMKRSGR